RAAQTPGSSPCPRKARLDPDKSGHLPARGCPPADTSYIVACSIGLHDADSGGRPAWTVHCAPPRWLTSQVAPTAWAGATDTSRAGRLKTGSLSGPEVHMRQAIVFGALVLVFACGGQ